MIRSFCSKETEELFNREIPRKIPFLIRKVALRKLLMIDAATQIADLRVPPGNHLESLQGIRKGQYSVRINKQWRICFRFENGNAFDVEIVDYH